MRIASVNVSAGRVVEWRGSPVETGIYKEPTATRVRVRELGLEGDRQADLRVHGGVFKAVYAYGVEDYAWWSAELGRELPWGVFGENLSIDGLNGLELCVGDIIRVGKVVLQATQPRLPCFKLGMRFDDPLIVKRFMHAGRFGVYFRVLEEGLLRKGARVRVVQRDEAVLSVAGLVPLLDADTRDAEAVSRALACAALPPTWIEALSEPPLEDVE